MKKSNSQWSAAEMGLLKPRQRATLLNKGVEKLEMVDVSSDTPSGKKLNSKFFYYSFIKASDTNRQTHKNVLFIPGGPGIIVDLEDLDRDKQGRENALELLEAEHNVAYLHVRGTGLSQIPRSNNFDRFLRADYVVEDIEKLRLHLLGNNTPWDAIWGESHGALIAQRYAHKYGTARVKRLVLIAPPSRSLESHSQRRNLMISNLEAIVRNHHGNASRSGPNKKTAEMEQNRNRTSPNHNNGDSTRDLSFVTDQHIREIKSKLNQVLEELDRTYASMSFAMENYAELKTQDPNFKSFPYPEEFFKSLRILQFYGRPEKNLKFPGAEQRRFNAALLIAHYLSLPKHKLNAPSDRGVTLRRSTSIGTLSPDRRRAYEKMFNAARHNILRDPQLKSQRAYYVFGVYDGISRWILDVMARQIRKDGFFRSQDIASCVTGPAAQDLVKKIGIVLGEPIYPWNPGYYKHNVATLIVRGSADALTAGGQAESFFEDGLANKSDSVLMEIPGMGHLWRPSMPQAKIDKKIIEGDQVLQTLVEKFLTTESAADFLEDPKVEAIVTAIRISVGGTSQSREIKLTAPKVKKLERKKLWHTILELRRRGVVIAIEENRGTTEVPRIKFSRPRRTH